MSNLFFWFYENAGNVLSFFGLVGIIGGMITYSHKRLHNDFLELKSDAKADRARIDAMGTRIDGIYQVLLAYIMGKNASSMEGKNE